MALELLCVGDIHLGRRPARLPADLSEWGIAAADLTPAAAWRRAVEVAVERPVHAVLLAGDVVESDNRFFEAYGPLEAGVRRLVGAGIRVIGVAGNHDTEVLPRLADEVEGFTLLGRGGRWETTVVDVPGSGVIRVLGWSYPDKVVRTSPLSSLPRLDVELPTIGLMHADVDGLDSPYAPVTSAELARAPGEAWLLGHIHRPSEMDKVPRGYLGNLCALDRGEQGLRGAWILSCAERKLTFTQLALSPLRWETVDVDAAPLAGQDELEAAILAAVRDRSREIANQLDNVRAVGCRVRLVGESQRHRALAEALRRIDARSLRVPVGGGTVFFVDSLRDDAREPADLPALARGSDPPALLARALLSIERGDPEGESMVAEATGELARTANLSSWGSLDPVADLSGVARRQLLRAGREALAELLAQREAK